MKQFFEEFVVQTRGQQLLDLTDIIVSFVANSKVESGLINISILHTSASLIIQENASEDVLYDLREYFDKIVPMGNDFYRHSDEGKDDMPSHIKSALTNTNLTLSIQNSELRLGKWQGIFLFEHRISEHRRRILAHIMGTS
tara:strand:- start:29 stop:451 length:423 start_codon:yes stop_codon:yes gene_type:complete